MTKTYTEFTAEHEGKFFWECDAGRDDDNRPMVDVLVYSSEEDMEEDDDNSLAIGRALVIDDRAENVVEVRQVSATDFVYGERGTIDAHGVLVGAFQNGKVVA